MAGEKDLEDLCQGYAIRNPCLIRVIRVPWMIEHG
jgi:hypothetical protein